MLPVTMPNRTDNTPLVHQRRYALRVLCKSRVQNVSSFDRVADTKAYSFRELKQPLSCCMALLLATTYPRFTKPLVATASHA